MKPLEGMNPFLVNMDYAGSLRRCLQTVTPSILPFFRDISKSVLNKMAKCNRIAFICVFILAFFFLPVIPTYVWQNQVLPFAHLCYEHPSALRIYVSSSYATFETIWDLTGYGTWYYGLIFVPNNPGYSFQFPPLGFQGSIFCNSPAGGDQQ